MQTFTTQVTEFIGEFDSELIIDIDDALPGDPNLPPDDVTATTADSTSSSASTLTADPILNAQVLLPKGD